MTKQELRKSIQLDSLFWVSDSIYVTRKTFKMGYRFSVSAKLCEDNIYSKLIRTKDNEVEEKILFTEEERREEHFENYDLAWDTFASSYVTDKEIDTGYETYIFDQKIIAVNRNGKLSFECDKVVNIGESKDEYSLTTSIDLNSNYIIKKLYPNYIYLYFLFVNVLTPPVVIISTEIIEKIWDFENKKDTILLNTSSMSFVKKTIVTKSLKPISTRDKIESVYASSSISKEIAQFNSQGVLKKYTNPTNMISYTNQYDKRYILLDNNEVSSIEYYLSDDCFEILSFDITKQFPIAYYRLENKKAHTILVYMLSYNEDIKTKRKKVFIEHAQKIYSKDIWSEAYDIMNGKGDEAYKINLLEKLVFKYLFTTDPEIKSKWRNIEIIKKMSRYKEAREFVSKKIDYIIKHYDIESSWASCKEFNFSDDIHLEMYFYNGNIYYLHATYKEDEIIHFKGQDGYNCFSSLSGIQYEVKEVENNKIFYHDNDCSFFIVDNSHIENYQSILSMKKPKVVYTRNIFGIPEPIMYTE